MNKHEDLIQDVENFISSNRTGKALEILAKAQLSGLDKDLIILNSRYSKIKEDQRLGVIDDDLAQRRINTLNRDLLELSEHIRKPVSGNFNSTIAKATSKESKFKLWWILVPLLMAGLVGGTLMVNKSKSGDIDKILIEKAKGSYDGLVKEGNNLFEKGEYENAQKKYYAALGAANGFTLSEVAAKKGIEKCEKALSQPKYKTTQDIQKALTEGVKIQAILSQDVKISKLYGLSYQGGIIFYIDPVTGIGLVAASKDLASTAYGCKGVSCGSDERKNGRRNTRKILEKCKEEQCAAKLAADFRGGGYQDWFLPSIYELEQLYKNIGLGTAENLGGFYPNQYRSSTEAGELASWQLDFKTGEIHTNSKNGYYPSRAVRACQ